MSGDKGGGGNIIGRQSGTTVKSEPAEPEQAGSEHGHGQVVGHEAPLSVPLSRPDDHDRGQGCHAAGCMHDQTTGKVKHAYLGQPAAVPPYPVTDRIVDQQCPEKTEERKRSKANPFGKSAGNECRSDNRKHTLINHKNSLRNSGRVLVAGSIGNTMEREPG